MTATATVSISGTVSGLSYGSKTLSGVVTSTDAVGDSTSVLLALGANTITLPDDATAVLITPPAGNVAVLTLKGVTGDTGIILHPTQPSFIAFGSGVTTFCLTSSALLTEPVVLSYI